MAIRLVSRTCIVLTLLVPTICAQEGGGAGQSPAPQAPPAGGPTPGGAGNVPGSPGRTPSPMPGREQVPQIGEPRERETPFPEIQRPIYISGKVILEDGSAPMDQVVIEKVCNGSPVPQGYTDSKGRFQFALGQNLAMMADASVSSTADSGGFGSPGLGRSSQGRGGFGGMGGGVNERDLIGCEIRATLPGFRSDVVQLSGRRMMDNPDVGTIVLRRLGNVEGLTISATSTMAPKDARKAHDKGRESAKKGKWEDAEKHLTKAVTIYPKYASAWYELGRVHEQNKKIPEARKAYAEALAADAKFVSPYLNLAGLSANEQNWQDVIDTTDRIIKLNPVDFPQAFFYNAVANLQLRKLDAAEKSAREAVRMDERHRMPKIEHVLGVILAQKNDLTGAAEHMQNYLKYAPKATDAEQVRKQLEEVDRLRGAASVSQK